MSLVAAGDRNGASLIARRRRLESFAPGGEIVGERDKGPFVRSPFGRSVGGSLARLAGPLSSRCNRSLIWSDGHASARVVSALTWANPRAVHSCFDEGQIRRRLQYDLPVSRQIVTGHPLQFDSELD